MKFCVIILLLSESCSFTYKLNIYVYGIYTFVHYRHDFDSIYNEPIDYNAMFWYIMETNKLHILTEVSKLTSEATVCYDSWKDEQTL